MIRDLIVIGGGPGGYVAAIRAAQLGMNVLLVERDVLGGTCLNRGCIPTKTFYQQASLLRSLASLASFNISVDSSSIRFDFAAAVERKNQIVRQLTSGIAGLLQSNGVEVVYGTAQIVGSGRVAVRPSESSPVGTSETIFETSRILIATGSENRPLQFPGSDLPNILDSTSILNLSAIPSQLTVVGGGVIGVEFASIFQTFGSEVRIVEAADQILPLLDSEISKRAAAFLKRQKIDVSTRTTLVEVRPLSSGKVEAVLQTPRGTTTISTDNVLVAVGRRALSESLFNDSVAITTNRGFIEVDENFETTSPGVFAIGDVIGRGMLAHLASEQGKVAVERMNGRNSTVSEAVPACVFSFPEIATVGLTTEQAEKRGIAVKTGKFLFASNGKAKTMGETDGFVKILADENDRIVGVHLVGPHASDLILEPTVWVEKRMSIDEIVPLIHPHPTLGETLYEAVLDLRREAIHSVKR